MSWPDGTRYEGSFDTPLSLADTNPCPVVIDWGNTTCRKGVGTMSWRDGESWTGEWKGDRPIGADAPARDYSGWPTFRAGDR